MLPTMTPIMLPHHVLLLGDNNDNDDVQITNTEQKNYRIWETHRHDKW